MKEKIKALALGIGLIILGIILLVVEADFRLMILGVIPISPKVIGVIGLVIGVLTTIVTLASKKK